MTNSKPRLRLVALAIASALAFGAVHAQSNTGGAIVGKAGNGDTIVVTNTETGLSRTVPVGSDGSYRASSLPVGDYRVELKRADGSTDLRDNVRVNVGTGTSVDFGATNAVMLEGVTVTASSISPIDVSSVESATILPEELIDRIPVARNVTAIALLAPGTTQGDSAFGNLASFGGATVGENAYYINGFNVTNFRNGLGGSTVPFEFYKEFQIKTGGYGAEFGRSTGGVVNTVTKRGTNEFHWGVNAFWTPSNLREESPCIFDNDGVQIGFGCQNDRDDTIEANVYASGPIVRDRLFFFALGNLRDAGVNFTDAGGNITRDTNDDPFWGVKLDWYMTDDHRLEYTGFSDKSYTERRDDSGLNTFQRGGRNDILKYTGFFGDSFTLSALYGEGETDRSDVGEGDACPLIIDIRSGATQFLGCSTSALPGTSFDTREAFRIDAEWDLGDFLWGSHFLRFGLDNETTTAEDSTQYSGGVYYLYRTLSSGQDVARERFYVKAGSFETDTSAFYLEDNWNVTEDVLLTLGIRNEQFDNKNGQGESFIEIKDQWAPRIGFSWDVSGDGTKKLFGNYGRYFLPIASNTNVRLAGGELFTEQFFELLGLNPDDTPQLGAATGPVRVFGDGSIPDPREIVDQNIDPMYQDEFILGYQQELFDGWSGGVRGIYRDLKSTIEDVAIDAALNDYAAANGFTDFEAGGFDYYVLTNPGTDMLIFVDLDGDGVLEEVNLTAAQLGYPESERKYAAVEFFFEKSWDNVWFLQGSYTWSHSYGNNEGYVRSDNGQDDAGLTTLFDQPGLLDGANGDLPNDRRHQFKLYGAWEFFPTWTASANLLWRSGRPINCFGNHPTDEFAEAYGSESFYCGGQLVPRGSVGRTDSITQLDLGLDWRPAFADGKLGVGFDVINVFDADDATEVNEVGEFDHDPDSFPRAAYLTPTAFQQPRYVRFKVSYDW